MADKTVDAETLTLLCAVRRILNCCELNTDEIEPHTLRCIDELTEALNPFGNLGSKEAAAASEAEDAEDILG